MRIDLHTHSTASDGTDTPAELVANAAAVGLDVVWLWAILWPEQSGLLMYDELVLTDLRDAGGEVDLVPCGALTPRLLAAPETPPRQGPGRR
ncbi:hypothetical protein OHB31_24640 [Streptomyces microflavus]|nr:hypothetical protein OHB31_24640 [Streptomyces microflavus]